MTEADWLDIEPSSSAGTNDDWLMIESIEDGNKHKVPYADIKFACMRGTDRVWACDGEYVAYRPFNHVLDKAVNPATRERHERFLEAGHYEHIGTFDEVQIFKLLDGSPFKRVTKNYIVGQDYWTDVRQAAKAACDRNWVDFHDLLEAMAKGIKEGRSAQFAQQAWEDALNQIHITIYQRSGPTPAETAAGVANVRRTRGLRSSVILTNAPGIFAGEAEKEK